MALLRECDGLDSRVVDARRLGLDYVREVDVGISGLQVRGPEQLACRAMNPGDGVICSTEAWQIVYRVEKESRGASTEELRAAERDGLAKDPIPVSFLGEIALAGFEGILSYSPGSKRPNRDWSFVGWSGKGEQRRKLVIVASNVDYRAEVVDSLEGFAILLTTTARVHASRE